MPHDSIAFGFQWCGLSVRHAVQFFDELVAAGGGGRRMAYAAETLILLVADQGQAKESRRRFGLITSFWLLEARAPSGVEALFFSSSRGLSTRCIEFSRSSCSHDEAQVLAFL